MTKIEWTDETWNPVRGCTRISEGCRNCYAERIAARFCGPGEPFDGFSRPVDGRWTGRVTLIDDKLYEPLHWRKPRRVFVNSMSDLFHEGLPDEDIDKVFAVMALCPQHTFQVLTKRPERMREYLNTSTVSDERRDDIALSAIELTREELPSGLQRFTHEQAFIKPDRWPLPNVWLGVSAENQTTADERVSVLLDTPAAVRFVSYEPALGPLNLAPYLCVGPMPGYSHEDCDVQTHWVSRNAHCRPQLNWIICGGESGPGARGCDVCWIEKVVEQCRAAGVAVFVKQLGSRPYRSPDHDGTTGYFVSIKDSKGGDPAEWPENLRVREYPDDG